MFYKGPLEDYRVNEAVRKCDYRTCKHLIKICGADCHCRGNGYDYPLLIAHKSGYRKMIKLLLRYTRDFEILREYYKLLMPACITWEQVKEKWADIQDINRIHLLDDYHNGTWLVYTDVEQERKVYMDRVIQVDEFFPIYDIEIVGENQDDFMFFMGRDIYRKRESLDPVEFKIAFHDSFYVEYPENRYEIDNAINWRKYHAIPMFMRERPLSITHKTTFDKPVYTVKYKRLNLIQYDVDGDFTMFRYST